MLNRTPHSARIPRADIDTDQVQAGGAIMLRDPDDSGIL